MDSTGKSAQGVTLLKRDRRRRSRRKELGVGIWEGIDSLIARILVCISDWAWAAYSGFQHFSE